MLTESSGQHQTNLFGSDLLLQLDPNAPLLQLAAVIPWQKIRGLRGLVSDSSISVWCEKIASYILYNK